MNTEIINFADLDFKKISFSAVKQNKYKSNYVNILYNGNIPLIKFPQMSAVFGISEMEDMSKSGVFNYSLETSFDNLNPSSSLKNVYEKALQFDDFIVKEVAKKHK